MSQTPDPAQLRISDAERHQVADVLRDAAGEGRLDVEELDERLEATYAAKTYADLVPIVADLPGNAPAPAGTTSSSTPARRSSGDLVNRPNRPVATRGWDTSIAVMGGQDRTGVWRVGATHQAFVLMGGVTLDLRDAEFASDEVVITANVVMGGIDVIVNSQTEIVVDGIGIMGGFDQARDKVEPDLRPDSPVVRVRGIALMGGVTVTRKPRAGEKKLPRRARKGLPGH